MTIQWQKLTADHCECWLGTVQWLKITIVLISNSAHLELSRDSWTTVSLITMVENTIMRFLWYPWKEWMWVWGTCLQCFYLTLLTLPSYFLALCPVYSLEIFIKNWPFALFYHIHIVILCCVKCTLKTYIVYSIFNNHLS